jgi:hypothetical protein
VRRVLLPHSAVYRFLAGGREAGLERAAIARAAEGWLVTSRLELGGATTELEWHLLPDLSTRILWISTRNAWGEEHDLELAITGNGVLASRGGPEGPSQVEMGWGPRVELDHLCAVFTTVLLARWDTEAEPQRDIDSVWIGAEDLVPQPWRQRWRTLEATADGLVAVERRVEAGVPARITVSQDGVVRDYDGLFALVELMVDR